MLRKILVPIRGDGKGDNVLAHAAAVAKRHGAHIIVAHCHARGETLLPYGVPLPQFLKDQILQQAEMAADQEEDRLKAHMNELADSLGLRTADGPDGNGVTVSWIEEEGRQVDVIRRHGRLADLIAVAKPDATSNLGVNSLKTALFNTGTPSMLCPPSETRPSSLCEKIAIAWNGSLEAARAVTLSMPIIRGASDVIILSSGRESDNAGADELLDYFKFHNIDARVELFSLDKKVGQALLDRSKEVGADVMIMGAYGDSYERETVFGGNTQYVVDHTDLPIILAH